MSRQLAFTLLLVCGQAVAAGTVIGTLAQEDPWIWIIGGFGAAIVYVKNPPTSRADAMVNSLISVMIGGLIAPPVALYCAAHIDKTLSSPYPFAFILSSAWPWLMPAIVDRVKALISGQKKSHTNQGSGTLTGVVTATPAPIPISPPVPKPRRRKTEATKPQHGNEERGDQE